MQVRVSSKRVLSKGILDQEATARKSLTISGNRICYDCRGIVVGSNLPGVHGSSLHNGSRNIACRSRRC